MLIKPLFFIIACSMLGLAACNTNRYEYQSVDYTQNDSVDFTYPVTLKYAKHFSIENLNNYKKIHIFNTSNGDTLITYTIALRGVELPKEITKNEYVIRVPVQTIVCLASTHVGALNVLNLRDKLVGATNLKNFWDEDITEMIKQGKISQVGKGMKADPEKIISLSPDVVIKNDYSDNIHEEELEKIGIGTICYSDKREGSLLARAEWLKLMGILFCQNEKSDSIFQNIENKYLAVKQIVAKQTTNKPEVLVVQDYNGTWYLPGDHNYVIDMIRDAHASVKTIPGVNTTMPCSFEKIYAEHWNDKYLISLKATTISNLADFKSSNQRYSEFEACKQGNVFINNQRVKSAGGNDFWESGTFNPDLVLKDLIKIFHPQLLEDYEMVYFRKLE